MTVLLTKKVQQRVCVCVCVAPLMSKWFLLSTPQLGGGDGLLHSSFLPSFSRLFLNAPKAVLQGGHAPNPDGGRANMMTFGLVGYPPPLTLS